LIFEQQEAYQAPSFSDFMAPSEQEKQNVHEAEQSV